MTSNQQNSQELYPVASAVTFSNPFVTYFSTRDPNPQDVNYPVQKRWLNTVLAKEWILTSYGNTTGVTLANWLLIPGGGTGALINVPVPNGTSPVVPSATGSISLTSSDNTITITGGTNTIDFKVGGGAGTIVEGLIPDNFTPPGTATVVPFNGNIRVLGALLAPGSTPLITLSLAANTLGIYTQISQALAAADATKVGLSNFNNAQFAVSATGFVSLAGSGGGASTLGLIPDTVSGSGTSPVVPNGAGNITINGGLSNAGTIPVQTNSQSANHLTVQVQISQALAATDATKVGLSNFSSSQFIVDANGFVSLSGGGTGPSIKNVVTQTFTNTGTYTPTANMIKCIVEVVGGGGGGGGSSTTNGAQISCSGAGGGGGYARGIFSSATIGVNQAVTIGAAGAAGAAGAGNGGTGGTTSVGALISATGGLGGLGSNPTAANANAGGFGGTGAGGDFQCSGSPGTTGAGFSSGGVQSGIGGTGGSTFFGGGAPNSVNTAVGYPGQSYGGGGGGAINGFSQTQQSGGAGFKGIVVITEYLT